MAPAAAPALTESIGDILQLLGNSDSVEFKLTIPDTDQRSAAMALGMDPLMAEIRQVVFFDTPDLALDKAGVVVRARRVQRGGDVVVKLRPVEPSDLPKKLRGNPGFGVEVDAMPGKFVCSGTLKAVADNAAINRVIAGKRPLRKLLTPTQRELFARHAPEGLDLDSLVPLGPITLVKLKFSPRRLQAPDGRGDVVLPQRHAHPRDLDEVPAGRGGNGPRERPSAAGRPRRGDDGSAADEDARRPHAFLEDRGGEGGRGGGGQVGVPRYA